MSHLAMHSSVSNLQHLPPRSQRVIQVFNAGPIPIYYEQVPYGSLAAIRGTLAPSPPVWPASAAQDRDGQYTWRIRCDNNVTIYIRSRPIPNDPPGVWALSPTQEEIFIPKSIVGFNIGYPNPPSPPIPEASRMAGPDNVPTLLTHLNDSSFHGRRCKVCGGHDRHDVYCPSIHTGYTCGWCFLANGSHLLGCSGFANQ